MQGNQGLRRRRFMQVAASGAAATVSCGGQKSRYRFLTNAEAETLAAICDVIIPPDQDPGASEAGVVQFIDRQLDGFNKKLRKQYRAGIALVDTLAQSRYGKSYSKLVPTDQEQILTGAECRRFFELAVSHTMQGYYGSPRHGGNRNWASWRMLGIPLSPLRGRAS